MNTLDLRKTSGLAFRKQLTELGDLACVIVAVHLAGQVGDVGPKRYLDGAEGHRSELVLDLGLG